MSIEQDMNENTIEIRGGKQIIKPVKFYGSGIIWDTENNKRLCKFVNGEYETNDKREIDLLKKAGYRSDDVGRKAVEGDEEGQTVETEQTKTEKTTEDEIRFEELTFNELKDLAKAKRMTVGHKSKADLIEALREGE